MLRREVSLGGPTALVVVGIVGSGIFALAATMGSVAGPATILALVLASVLKGAFLIVLPSFPPVALLASITTLVPYAAASLALVVLPRNGPNAERPFRLPWVRALTPAALVMATILIYGASWPGALMSMIRMFMGFPLYFLFTQPSFRAAAKMLEIGIATVALAAVGLGTVYAVPAGSFTLGRNAGGP